MQEVKACCCQMLTSWWALSHLPRQPHICSKADQTWASSNWKAKITFSLKTKQRLIQLSRAPQLRFSTAWTGPCCSQSGLAHEQTSKTFLNTRSSPSPQSHSSGWKATGTKGLNTAGSQRTTCVQVSCNETTQLCSRSGDNTSLPGIVQIQSLITHHVLGNYSSDTTAQIFTSCWIPVLTAAEILG